MNATPPAPSLRRRLVIVILAPLIFIAAIIGIWRYQAAEATAERAFDRALTAVTLAIARDVAISGGDVLTDVTQRLIRSALAGEVYYHVYGPDGGFVTGYATPPPPPRERAAELRRPGAPQLYHSTYRGEPVRVARMTETASVDGLSGPASITVWHPNAARDAFARRVATNALWLVGVLLLAAAAIIWFGVRIGLRPLTSLEDAIAKRSAEDLTAIRRPAPPEIQGVVGALNRLLAQARDALATRDAFIADAAHQLRNPIAGVLVLAEAARNAPHNAARAARVEELLEAARHAGRLTEQFLTYERARLGAAAQEFAQLDLAELTREVAGRRIARLLSRDIDIAFEIAPEDDPAMTLGHRVLLTAALENLIENALSHAGVAMTKITLSLRRRGAHLILSVVDDGAGLTEDAAAHAFERYRQGGSPTSSGGSGLGLAIVREIARAHGGEARIDDVAIGASVSLTLPALISEQEIPQ